MGLSKCILLHQNHSWINLFHFSSRKARKATMASNPSNGNGYMKNQNSSTTSTLFEEDDGPIAIRDWPEGCHPITKKRQSKTTMAVNRRKTKILSVNRKKTKILSRT